MHLVATAAAGFESADSNFARGSTASKMSNNVLCYGEITHEKKNQLMWQTPLLSYFKENTTATPPFSHHHPALSAARDTEARRLRLSRWLESCVSNKVFLIKVCTLAF